MVLLETLAAASAGAKQLFLYNRQSYVFDKTIRQKCEYQVQDMRILQAGLYRDDIRDLFHLTIKKMDIYLLVSTTALLSTFGVVSSGRASVDIPAWLFFLWAQSAVSAVVFLLLSTWFAIHASVSAQIYVTRIRTQWLRLPIPKMQDIAAETARLEDFETVSPRQSLRVPIVDVPKEDYTEAMNREDAASKSRILGLGEPLTSAAGQRTSSSSMSSADIGTMTVAEIQRNMNRGYSADLRSEPQRRSSLIPHSADFGRFDIGRHLSMRPGIGEGVLARRLSNLRERDPGTPLSRDGGVRAAEKSYDALAATDAVTDQQAAAQDIVKFTDHLLLYQELFSKFQGYDAFARVSLVTGVICSMNLLGYTGMNGYLMASSQQGAWCFPIVTSAFTCATCYLNILLKKREMVVLFVVSFLGPVLAVTGGTHQFLISSNRSASLAKILAPFTCFCHFIQLGICFKATWHRNAGLPTKYSAVINLDLVGANRKNDEEEFQLDEAIPRASVIKKALDDSPRLRELKSGRTGDWKGIANRSGSHAVLDSGEHEVARLRMGTVDVDSSASTDSDIFAGFRNDAPAHSFNRICILFMCLWLIGVAVGVLTASGVSFTGWDNSPPENILPYTGQDVTQLR